ncbi:MAG: efflux RND transporter permease subunit, partial [Acidobacteriota bacterium]
RRVDSVSQEGISILSLEFAWGTDMDFAMLHTREKLDNVLLPEDVEGPAIIPLDPQSQPIMILSISGIGSLLELKEFSEELVKPRLEQIEGVGSAEIAGGVEREIHVEVRPDLLSLFGLTIDQVSQRIDAFNRNLQGGTIRKGRFKYALRVVGEFEQLTEIGEIVLKTTESRGVVQLKDVAAVRDSLKEREGITRLNGEESIGVLVRKESGANTVDVTKKVKDVLEEIRQEYLQVDVHVVSEQAKYITNAISSVVKSIIFGAILAFFVLFIFLQDLKTPLIIFVVIPIAVIATFNILYFQDITLNIMSLGGLALGIGMLVDNSIVVSESIFRHKSLGKSLKQAAQVGTAEVGMAVTASTFTTVSVFLPVIYVHGMAGQLFKDQALTVTFALLSSLFVSLTLLPMLSSRKLAQSNGSFKEKKKSDQEEKEDLIPKKTRFYHLFLIWFRWLRSRIFKLIGWLIEALISFLGQIMLLFFHYLSLPLRPVIKTVFKGFNFAYSEFSHKYHAFLEYSLNKKVKIIGASLIFLGITIFLSLQLPRELLPKPRETSFEINLETPVDYSLEQTAKVAESLEKWLIEQSSVKACFAQIGVVSGMESLNPEVSLNNAKIYVEAYAPHQIEEIITGLRQRLTMFTGLRYSLVEEQSALSQFLAFSTSEVSLKIKGEELEILSGLAEELMEKLESIPGVVDINSNIKKGKPVFLVQVNPQALEKYNISPGEISNFLVNAVRGRVASQFKELEKKYDIRVWWEKEKRQGLEDLMNESFPHQGTLIPMRELVSYTLVEGPQEIRRESQQREVVVTANLKGRKLSHVIPDIKEKIAELNLPPKYRVEFGGEQEEMSRSFQSLILALALAIILVYMIMSAQFESLKHPFIILLTLPMGLTGSIWALFITGQSINVISVIGMVVLAGIVVNDAIVKIDYTNKIRASGYNLRESILEASRVRLRPIMMTTVTTIFGLFPMALGLGRGAELQQPLAISVIGGLLLATFLTLILIPVVYEIMEKRSLR